MKEKIRSNAACWVTGSPLTLTSALPSQNRLPRECVPSFLKQILPLNRGPSSTLVAKQWVSEICLSPNQCLECRGYKWALMCLDLTWVPGNRTQVPMLSKQPLYTKWVPFALPNFSKEVSLFGDYSLMDVAFSFAALPLWLETLEYLLIYYEYIFVFENCIN